MQGLHLCSVTYAFQSGEVGAVGRHAALLVAQGNIHEAGNVRMVEIVQENRHKSLLVPLNHVQVSVDHIPSNGKIIYYDLF